MSRCLPFPPPGYERKSTRVVLVPDEAALIQESIKREQDKPEKERRKEKKREKKEKKRKDKEEKSSTKGGSEKKNHKHQTEGPSDDYQRKKKSEIEQLERSGLSEEHGPPTTSVPKLCGSSDSTQNSGKRKRPSSPLDSCQNQSTVLRIRLPIVVKQRDTEELHTKEQLRSSLIRAESTSSKRAKIDTSANIKQLSTVPERYLVPGRCSSAPVVTASAGIGPNASIQQSGSLSRRFKDTAAPVVPAAADVVASTSRKHSSSVSKRNKATVAPVVSAVADVGSNPSIKHPSSVKKRIRETAQCSSKLGVAAAGGFQPSIEQLLCSTSGRTEVPVQDSSAAAAAAPAELSPSEISSLSDKHLRRVLRKWVPPVIDMEMDSGDVDWLFDAPARREPVVPKVTHVATCHEDSSSCLWPKARYLPEFGIYALPYTVPF